MLFRKLTRRNPCRTNCRRYCNPCQNGCCPNTCCSNNCQNCCQNNCCQQTQCPAQQCCTCTCERKICCTTQVQPPVCPPPPQIETRVFLERYIDVPMQVYYGPGYTETDCCVEQNQILRDIASTLKAPRQTCFSNSRSYSCQKCSRC